jgi:hypothetical protein
MQDLLLKKKDALLTEQLPASREAGLRRLRTGRQVKGQFDPADCRWSGQQAAVRRRDRSGIERTDTRPAARRRELAPATGIDRPKLAELIFS